MYFASNEQKEEAKKKENTFIRRKKYPKWAKFECVEWWMDNRQILCANSGVSVLLKHRERERFKHQNKVVKSFPLLAVQLQHIPAFNSCFRFFPFFRIEIFICYCVRIIKRKRTETSDKHKSYSCLLQSTHFVYLFTFYSIYRHRTILTCWVRVSYFFDVSPFNWMCMRSRFIH